MNKRQNRQVHHSAISSLLLLILFMVMPVSHATTWNVTTEIDEADGECVIDCSLRDAITLANADASATSGSPHIINIPDGTYTITLNGIDYANASGDFDVKNYIKFQGESQAFTIIEGTAGIPKDRVFQDADSDGEMTFDSLTIRNGDSTGLSDKEGGCIRMDGNALTLNNVKMDNCKATYGGAIVVATNAGGNLTITNSTFTNNSTTSSGGGAIAQNHTSNTILIDASTFIDNTAGANVGGAVAGQTITVQNGSVFKGNSAPNNGGAVWANVDLTVTDSTFGGMGVGEGNTSNWGGALFLVTANQLLVERSTFIKNVANESGGAIGSYGFTVRSSIFEYNRADGAEGGGALYSSGDNHIYINNDAAGGSESRFSYNETTAGCGGAIRLNAPNNGYKITANDSTFNNNTSALQGGAICGQRPSKTSLVDTNGSHFANNTAAWWGGAIFARGAITITNSSFDTNVSGGRGGAVTSWQAVTAKNSTFYNNSSDGSYEATQQFGGAIFGGALTINNCTFADNDAPDSGSAIYGTSGAPNNSIFYNSVAKNQNFCTSQNNGNGYNLIYDGAAGTGVCYGTAHANDVAGNPQLAALAFNGHSVTKTMALGASSLAIDQGNDATDEATDQRGTARTDISGVGDASTLADIGAFEYELIILADHVCATGCEFTTIQGAIDDVGTVNGSTITVHDGTYSENINFNGKLITVVSQNGAGLTKIQGSGAAAAVVTFDSGETSSAVLDGFTIDNQGTGASNRGIKIIASSSPTIQNSIIEGNVLQTTSATTENYGGGIYIDGGGVTISSTTIGQNGTPNQANKGSGIYAINGSDINISNSTISYNSGRDYGGIYLGNMTGTTTLTNVNVTHNNAGSYFTGGIFATASSISITGGSISNNTGIQGAALRLENAPTVTTINNVTIDGNTSTAQISGGIYSLSSPMAISNGTVISNNSSRDGAGIYMTGNYSAFAAGTKTTIDNTTINNNNANGYMGGGILSDGSPIEITNSTITANSGRQGSGIRLLNLPLVTVITNTDITSNIGGAISGGGIYSDSSPLTITGGSISSNTGSRDGGGLYITGSYAAFAAGTKTTIDGTTMNSNSSSSYPGGAIYSNTMPISISNATINSNSASIGAAIYLTGLTEIATIDTVTIDGNINSAAINGGALHSNDSPITLTSATITNNTAARSGAGIFLTGTYSGFPGGTATTITSSTISGNTVGGNYAGGGISSGSPLEIDKSYIQGNRGGQGGGINSTSTLTITNSIITGNTADRSTINDGGGIYASGTTTIMNSTIAGNYAWDDGGGIWTNGTITNSIIYGNTAGDAVLKQYAGSPTITYSDVEGGGTTDGNINGNPLFVDLQQASNANPTTAGNFHLCNASGDPVGCASGPSPALDVGTATGAPSNDIDGDSRFQGTGYDMGADEYPAGAATNTVVGTVTATAASATSINVSMGYSSDGNTNNTYTVEYKLSSEPTTWTAWVTAAANTATPYTTTITGLTDNETYDVRMTFNDVDGVTGTNPTTVSSIALPSDKTTAGVATAVVGGATAIDVSMPYTDDNNTNNTYTVEYKLSSEPTTWTAWVTAAANTTSPYNTSITGLTTGSSYDVRVTYNDADGVTGSAVQTINGITPAAAPLSVPGTYATIQAAIDASSNGDIIEVADGTYPENINFNNKVVTVRSINGAASTFITSDGTSNAPVVTFANSALTSSAVLDGFTINNSTAANTATRGISITASSAPTLKNLVLKGNKAAMSISGGAIYINGATATIQDSTIGDSTDKNEADEGAGMYVTGLTGALTISGTTFLDNYVDDRGAAIYLDSNTSFATTITNSAFTSNDAAYGGAIALNANTGQTTVISSTNFTGNTSSQFGGAIYSIGSPLSVTGGTWTGNDAVTDGGVYYLSGTAATLSISGGSYTLNQGRSGGAIFGTSSGALTISNAFIDDNDSTSYGTIYMTGATGTSTISNTSIDSNTSVASGSGIYFATASSANLTLNSGTTVDANVISNTASFDGGGIHLSGAVTFSMTGGSVSNNVGRSGGGIFSTGIANLTIDGTTIDGNNSINGYGGGIYILDVTNAVDISNATIANNIGLNGGAAIYYKTSSVATYDITDTNITDNVHSATNMDGGALYINSGTTTATISGSTISGSSTRGGGGIYATGTVTLNINDSTINSNTASGYGGAIFMATASATLNMSKSFVQGNNAKDGGGGIYLATGVISTITNCVISGNRLHTNDWRYGGGISSNGTLNLYNSTIAGNYAYREGGGLYANGTETIRNTIIYGNLADLGTNDNIYGTAETITTSSTTGTDPLFVDLQAATSTTQTANGDFRLCLTTNDPAVGCGASQSPGIDTGASTDAPATDIVGESRPQGADYDMGAYEYPAGAAVNSTTAGTATAVSGGPTSIDVSMPYTNDSNSNNTYTVDYKLSSEPTTWTNWVTAAANAASPYQTSITGLTTSSSYDIRVTYNDADGVNGTNPQTISSVIPTATTYTVTKTADTNDGTCDADCSLREAVAAANADAEQNIISIPANIGGNPFDITRSGSDDTNVNGDFDITNPVIIRGAGSASTTIRAGSSVATAIDRIFHVTNASAVTIEDLKIQYGELTAKGGCVYAASDITFKNVIVDSCQATSNQGGAIYTAGAVTLDNTTVSNGFSGAGGGGIWTHGMTILNGATIDSNYAVNYAGGVFSDSITNKIIGSGTISFTGNTTQKATNDNGGAIYAKANVELTGSVTFSGNQAYKGGAVYVEGASFQAENATFNDNLAGTLGGGALLASGITLTGNTTFQRNSAPNSGGAILNESGTVSIDGGTVLFDDNDAGTDSSTDYGGAIYSNGPVEINLTSGSATFTNNGNSAWKGGAIYGETSVSVKNATFDSNSTVGVGGAIHARGFTATNSTFSNNTGGTSGGAVINFDNDTTITNSTFSGNISGDQGGALYANAGVCNIKASTFYANSAASTADTLRLGSCTITHTIIDDNDADGLGNCSGTVTSGGYNIENKNTCSFSGTGDLHTTDPLLLPLADNGGPTKTHALPLTPSQSPAIDAGLDATCTASPISSKDQRGQTRPVNGDGGADANECDIGAYEYQPPAAVTLSGSVFTNEGTSKVPVEVSVRLLINGTSAQTTTTVGGDYSFTASPAAGNVLTVHVDNDGTYAATTVTVSDSNALTGLDLYDKRVITRFDNGAGALTTANMATADDGDADILYNTTSGLTIEGTDTELFIWGGDTFTPGSTIDTIHMDINGTLTAEANAINVSGNWDAAGGTFTSAGTVVFDGTTDQTITTNGQAFNNLSLNNTGTNGSADNIIISGTLDVNGFLSISDGDMDIGSSNPAVATAGDVIIGANGTIDVTARTANWTFDGTTNLIDASSGQDFEDVVVNGTSLTLASHAKVETMTITTGTLDLGSSAYVLEIDGTGTPLSNSATFTAGTSTVKYTGTTTATNIATLPYNNLQLAPTAATTYSLMGHQTIGNALTGNLVIDTNATLDATAANNYNLSAINITINGTYDAQASTITTSGDWVMTLGTFNHGTSTVDFTGTGSITNDNAAWWEKMFYNVNAAAASQTTTIYAGRGIVVNNVLTLGTGIVAGGDIILSQGSGSPLVTSGATLSNTVIKYDGSTGPVNVAATTYPSLRLAGNSASNSFNLAGNISCTSLQVFGNAAGKSANLDTTTNNYTINCATAKIGATDGTAYGTVKLNGSVLTLTDWLDIKASDVSGTNSIDADTSTINVAGNWINNDTFTADTSTVILNGTSQAVNGTTTFHHLTKSVAAADTLTFEAGKTTTIGGTATLNGATSQLLTLASSIPGTHWKIVITAGATKAISFVSVSWSDASGSDASQKAINPTDSDDGLNNIDWFSGTPTIAVSKSSSVFSDPINGTTNPLRIPGAIVVYQITTENSGDGSPDANSTVITDVVDSTITAVNTTEGVTFTDGTTSSALALGTVSYSSTPAPGPYVYDYTPVPDGDGYDGNVTSIKVETTGTFAFGGAPTASFILKYKARVK